MRRVRRKPLSREEHETPEIPQETLEWGMYERSDEVRDRYGKFFADILTVGPGWQKGYDIGRAGHGKNVLRRDKVIAVRP